MQHWKSVLNGLLVIAATGSIYAFLDHASDPANPFSDREAKQTPIRHSYGGGVQFRVAEPPPSDEKEVAEQARRKEESADS